MAEKLVRIKQRCDTAANWTAANPVLFKGELGIEIDTMKTKIGDGTTAWTSLQYSKSDGVGKEYLVSGVVKGEMPGRALKMILERLDLHREELLQNWYNAQNGIPLNKIEPLK